ncbi:TetR/AcrR family transcriptional regulator [Thermomonospora catenispora]|nr:TetR/AcrR family transcriptional regulator [Thermomonospora catenispora]
MMVRRSADLSNNGRWGGYLCGDSGDMSGMEAHNEARARGEETGRDQIYAAALRLFARLGYDGTTTEMIASAAGVDRGEVMAAGGRTGVYRGLLERFSQEQCRMLERVAAQIAPDADWRRALIDRALDFYLQHLEELAVWQQRALSDAADMTDLEQLYQEPIRRKAAQLLGGDPTNDPAFQMLFSVFTWCLAGFATRGISQPDGSTLGPGDPRAQAVFRGYMAELLERLCPQ